MRSGDADAGYDLPLVVLDDAGHRRGCDALRERARARPEQGQPEHERKGSQNAATHVNSIFEGLCEGTRNSNPAVSRRYDKKGRRGRPDGLWIQLVVATIYCVTPAAFCLRRSAAFVLRASASLMSDCCLLGSFSRFACRRRSSPL